MVGGNAGTLIAIGGAGLGLFGLYIWQRGDWRAPPLEVIARLPKVAGAGATATGNPSIASHRASISERGKRSLFRALHYPFSSAAGGAGSRRSAERFCRAATSDRPSPCAAPRESVDLMTNDDKLRTGNRDPEAGARKDIIEV